VRFGLVLPLLTEFFEREKIDFGLIGGVAMQAYGLSRFTSDLDFVVDSSAQDSVVAELESRGYETLQRSDGYSNHLHPNSEMGRIDLVYVSGVTSRQIFEGVRKRPLGSTTIPVVRAEHLVAMKLLASSNDPSRATADLGDIQHLMSLADIDLAEVREYFVRYGKLEYFDELAKYISPE